MVVQGYYRHYKGGVYQVIGVAKNSENLEEKVVYRAVDGQLWERPLSMWNEEVNGIPRFKYYTDKRQGQLEFLIRQKAYRDGRKKGE